MSRRMRLSHNKPIGSILMWSSLAIWVRGVAVSENQLFFSFTILPLPLPVENQTNCKEYATTRNTNTLPTSILSARTLMVSALFPPRTFSGPNAQDIQGHARYVSHSRPYDVQLNSDTSSVRHEAQTTYVHATGNTENIERKT